MRCFDDSFKAGSWISHWRQYATFVYTFVALVGIFLLLALKPGTRTSTPHKTLKLGTIKEERAHRNFTLFSFPISLPVVVLGTCRNPLSSIGILERSS